MYRKLQENVVMPDKDPTYKVIVNGHVFFFTRSQVEAIDLSPLHDNHYNLIHQQQSVNAEVVTTDASLKNLTLSIEGESFKIAIKDELDQLLEQMGWNAAAAKKIKDIKAPMPGLVLEVSVTEGQEVHDGDRIAILEAMKMENSIVVHMSARIKKVHVKAGQPVEKGQVLVEFE